MSEVSPTHESSERDIEAEIAMHQAFDLWLPAHATNVITPLPYNPDFYPSQKINVGVVRPGNPSIETAFAYCRHAMGEGFDELVASLQTSGLAKLAEARYKNGQNTLVVTPHAQNVLDTAVGHAAFLCASGNEAFAYRNGIMSSKLMSRLAIGGIPAVDILANSGNVYLGIPFTSSAKRVGFSKAISSEVNRVMNEALENDLSTGTIVHWALSSSVAKNGVMPRVRNGLAQYIAQHFDFTVGLAIWQNSGSGSSNSAVISPVDASIRHRDDVHTLMEELADKVSALSGGTEISYDSPPDLIRRKRFVGSIADNQTRLS